MQYLEEYNEKTEDFKCRYNKLNADAKKLGWSLELRNEDLENSEYFKKIKDSLDEYISKLYSFKIIPFCSDNKMPCIIDRAIEKKHPFFGNKKTEKNIQMLVLKILYF